MPRPLIPRDRRFHNLFEAQAAKMVSAAEVLRRAFGNIEALPERQAEIKKFEHEGDELTHEVVRVLNRTFVTPFDREDIYALSSGLDDVLDYIDELAETFLLYRIDAVPPAANEMVRLLILAVEELQRAIEKLESRRGIEQHTIEVHRIENLGDDASRLAIAELFSGAHDPLTVIKLKDVYTLLENSLDRCEDVATIIENIIIKNA
ncbi:MAG: DUF47 domain-containing protein [Candidatus Dormibacteraeota bacterium]|nr:DUF47 domain-containing protein [Candidatus Dormibacteraeota bacterium]